MQWRSWSLAPVVAICLPAAAQAQAYLSVAQAQQLMFPGARLTHLPVTLSEAQAKALRASTGIWQPMQTDMVWQVANGGYFIVDKVLGKHEMISFAVGLNEDGSVRQVEVLEYNESYGYEVRDPAWRQQFVGKTAASPVRLNADIRNISGATLSSKHITDGVRRILQFYGMVLKHAG